MQDIKYENGDISLTGNDFVTEIDLLKQRLNIKFKWFQEEYVYDTSYGIPYFQEILGKKKANIYDVFDILTSKIEEEYGVVSVKISDFDFDSQTRKMTITFAINTIYGDLTYTQNI